MPDRISLCYHDQEFLGLIVPAPTGLIWDNQVGGTTCSTGVLEGYYIPLDVGLLPEGNLLRDFADPYDPELAANFLEGTMLEPFFEAPTLAEVDALPVPAIDGYVRRQSLLCEAWLPVKVRSELLDSHFAAEAVLGHILGVTCILTWLNSD